MHEHISPIMDAEWEPAQTYVNPYHCSDPVEYHRRVMRRRQRKEERRARQFDRFVRNLFRFAVVLYITVTNIALLVG